MNWLRIPGIVPEDIHLIHEDGQLARVEVPCDLTTGFEPCCSEPIIVKNGGKVVKYRDRRIEAAPTWLCIRRQQIKCKARAEAEASYRNWIDTVKEFDQHAEWKPLMKMVQVHRDEIFAYFEHRFTSGKVERMNRSIADINRDANGLDFVSLRAKALLRHGTLVPEEAYTLFCIDPDYVPPADPYPRPAGIISTRNAG